MATAVHCDAISNFRVDSAGILDNDTDSNIIEKTGIDATALGQRVQAMDAYSNGSYPNGDCGLNMTEAGTKRADAMYLKVNS